MTRLVSPTPSACSSSRMPFRLNGASTCWFSPAPKGAARAAATSLSRASAGTTTARSGFSASAGSATTSTAATGWFASASSFGSRNLGPLGLLVPWIPGSPLFWQVHQEFVRTGGFFFSPNTKSRFHYICAFRRLADRAYRGFLRIKSNADSRGFFRFKIIVFSKTKISRSETI